MDYQTKKGMSREDARTIAKVFRTLMGYDNFSPFDPVKTLDELPDYLPDVDYDVVENDAMPKNVPAACNLEPDGSFVIKIKENVYRGASERQVGGYLMDITHEIVHAFLFKIGYTPSVERSFQNNMIPAYLSAEWQAKAVAGEIMIPYEASKRMSVQEIENIFHVSESAARERLSLQ